MSGCNLSTKMVTDSLREMSVKSSNRYGITAPFEKMDYGRLTTSTISPEQEYGPGAQT